MDAFPPVAGRTAVYSHFCINVRWNFNKLAVDHVRLLLAFIKHGHDCIFCASDFPSEVHRTSTKWNESQISFVWIFPFASGMPLGQSKKLNVSEGDREWEREDRKGGRKGGRWRRKRSIQSIAKFLPAANTAWAEQKRQWRSSCRLIRISFGSHYRRPQIKFHFLEWIVIFVPLIHKWIMTPLWPYYNTRGN